MYELKQISTETAVCSVAVLGTEVAFPDAMRCAFEIFVYSLRTCSLPFQRSHLNNKLQQFRRNTRLCPLF